MEQQLKKCLLCKNPFCTKCPAQTEVRRIIELVRIGKTEEAGAILFDNNPLSAITGAVCPNHLFCKGSCILNRKGDPVDFGKIEKEVSRNYLECIAHGGDLLEKHSAVFKNNNDKKVLIIGSGPAGLALSYYLRKSGFDVTVYEKNKKFGGMLRYGIPDFRLDKCLIDNLVNALSNFGVKFETETEVNINNLPSGFDIIIMAVGAGISKKLGIEGETLATPALEYLKTPNTAERAIVIGAGNVAIDCALTAVELGAKSVNLCYRRDEVAMKAYPEELEYARNKGVVFNYFHVPKKISEYNGSILGAIFDKQGEEIFIPADKVIIAIGQTATESGLLKVDGFKTERENVYALGDAVTGTSTIIQVVAQAKELARELGDL